MFHIPLRTETPFEVRIHCDEVGRGPLAGPVTVGCCLALQKIELPGCKDSKQLTSTARKSQYALLKNYETAGKLLISTGRASHREIDKHGIIKAIHIATIRGIYILLKKLYTLHRRDWLLSSDRGEDKIALHALDRLMQRKKGTANLVKQISKIPQFGVIFRGLLRDGNHTFGLEKSLDRTVITIVKGDQKNPLIAAASIVAKVERDERMQQAGDRYKQYGFSQHKGYGTVAHRAYIEKNGLSALHRVSFCRQISTTFSRSHLLTALPRLPKNGNVRNVPISPKPSLLLHICCAPDLSWPLHRLKDHFKLYLFRYNPNIHPRKEHEHRYAQFLKLTGLEQGDYEILEDWYDPKEFFDAMMEQRTTIHPDLHDAPRRKVLQVAGDMEERSERCNPCYAMRLEAAANMAAKAGLPYFTSTLLISPKKKMDKLYRRGKEAEHVYPTTKFLRFDFAKNDGYHQAVKLTKTYGLWRQHYCGCGRTIPKDGTITTNYQGG